MKWNEKNIKSRYWNPNIGGQEIKEFSAKEILSNPNYHQIESIVHALAKVVVELADQEEQRVSRIMSLNNPAQTSFLKDE